MGEFRNLRENKEKEKQDAKQSCLFCDADSKYAEVAERQRTLLSLAGFLHVLMPKWVPSAWGSAVPPEEW